jgi:hypothetical protein
MNLFFYILSTLDVWGRTSKYYNNSKLFYYNWEKMDGRVNILDYWFRFLVQLVADDSFPLQLAFIFEWCCWCQFWLWTRWWGKLCICTILPTLATRSLSTLPELSLLLKQIQNDLIQVRLGKLDARFKFGPLSKKPFCRVIRARRQIILCFYFDWVFFWTLGLYLIISH